MGEYIAPLETAWDEFYRVIRGHGPCNKERLALRRFSYEQGAWVRRAIMNQGGSLPLGSN